MSQRSPKNYQPNKKESAVVDKCPNIVRRKRSRRTRAYVFYAKLVTREQREINFPSSVLGVRYNGGDGQWICVCATHRESKKYATSHLADEASRNPEKFCYKCNDYTSGVGVEIDEPGVF